MRGGQPPRLQKSIFDIFNSRLSYIHAYALITITKAKHFVSPSTSCHAAVVQLSMSLASAMGHEPVIWPTNSNGTPEVYRTSLPPPTLPLQTIDGWALYLLLSPRLPSHCHLIASADSQSDTFQLWTPCALRHSRPAKRCQQTVRVRGITPPLPSSFGHILTRSADSPSLNMRVAVTQMMPTTRCTTSVWGGMMS